MERTYRINDDMSAETKKGLIELVQTDMQVIEVPTVGADQTSDGGLSQEVANVFGFGSGLAVSPDFLPRLVSNVFIEIDGDGLTDSDLCVGADEISGVSSGTVRLARSRDQMINEACHRGFI